MSGTAVLYCIRAEDGFAKFIRFIVSLSAFPIEEADLHVLLKSSDQKFNEQIYATMKANSVNGRIHLVPDLGFDLGSYKLFIQDSDYDYFVLMSASSVPMKHKWVSMLITPLTNQTSKLVGSMASWESLSTNVFESHSYALEKKIITNFLSILNPDSVLAKRLGQYLRIRTELSPTFKFLALGLPSKLGAAIYFLLHPRRILRRISGFPAFPNPHIRSTGMAVSKDLFMKACSKIPRDKIDVMLLESGRFSLTSFAISTGCNPLVVVGDEYFSPRDPRVRKTFRCAGIEPPLVADHHYERFIQGSPKYQKRMSQVTWGV